MNAVDLLTTGQAADEITRTVGQTILPWQVARIFELRLLPEPPRFNNQRTHTRESLQLIIATMRKRGWISSEEPANV